MAQESMPELGFLGVFAPPFPCSVKIPQPVFPPDVPSRPVGLWEGAGAGRGLLREALGGVGAPMEK